jgi:hypothetical protein
LIKLATPAGLEPATSRLEGGIGEHVAQHHQTAMQAHLAQEHARAKELVEELRDEASAKAFASDARAYLKESGFRDDEVAQIQDARILKVVNDARKYRALMRGEDAPSPSPSPAPAPRPVRTGPRPKPAKPKNWNDRSMHDKANWLASRI